MVDGSIISNSDPVSMDESTNPCNDPEPSFMEDIVVLSNFLNH